MNKKDIPIKFGFSKYKNIGGVTCYMNSILHILQQAPMFVEWITYAKFSDVIKNKIKKKNNVNSFVIFELFKLFKNSLESDDLSIIPITFKQLIGEINNQWSEPNHQDSQEFLNWLISKLEDEVGIKTMYVPSYNINTKNLNFTDSIKNIIAIYNTVQCHNKEWSILKELFNGLLQNITQCDICSCQYFDYQPFVNLSVSIPLKNRNDNNEYSLLDCLDDTFKKEQLDSDNKINCSLCGFENRSFRNSKIWSAPKILVIQIKRFIVNDFGIPTQKITNKINYEIENLDLSNYIDKSSPHIDKCLYNLFGINIHQSLGFKRNTNMGHYTSIVKSNIDFKWYYMNDSDPIQLINKKEQLIQSDAYLLFYYRIN